MSLELFVAVVVVLICALTDLRSRKIYNLVTYPTIVAGIFYHVYWGGATGLTESLCGFAFGISILIIPFLLGGTGAGDSKLLGALGAWLRLPEIVYVFIVAGSLCGAASLVHIVWRNTHLIKHPIMAFASLRFGILPVSNTDDGQRELPQVVKKSFGLPFALLVCIGVFAVLLHNLAEY